MREIKFRGYSRSRKTWIYGDLQTPIKNNNIPFIRQLDKDGWFSVEEASIGQYTGFKDENDKEIYEGDIIKNYDDMTTGAVVSDSSGEWLYGDDYSLYESQAFVNKLEVIGNIYENKLKEEK